VLIKLPSNSVIKQLDICKVACGSCVPSFQK
jgi:hypothetical protein